MSIHTQTLADLSRSLHSGAFSSEELVRHYLARINQHDNKLNSFITVTEASALDAAKAADAARAKGDTRPLLGIPIAHKDLFCTAGVRTSCGSKMLDNFVSPYDACIVERLSAAGTISLGKLNCDEFGMGSSNENSFYGPCKNPWDLDRVPGGSSGGSAAAVAAGLVAASTGTDTGGSIRQPAALCGISGLKPTYGRISRYGMVAFASSFDSAGPFAQTAEDLAWMLAAMAGFDERDSTSIDRPVPDYVAQLQDDIQGLRIGLPKQFFSQDLDSNVADSIHQALKVLEDQGATLVDVELPHIHLSMPTYYVLALAEASSNLARYDGVRFGHRCKDPKDLDDLYKRSRSEGFGEEVKRRILTGTYALSAGYYDAYYLKAQRVRRLIAEDFATCFKQVDLIASPTVPAPAFKLGEKLNDPISMYLSDLYTIANNLAGLPGLSLPAPKVAGLPVGLQLIGQHFDEARLLNAGHRLQSASSWHVDYAPIKQSD